MKKFVVFFAIATLSLLTISAQTLPLPYFCGFEDATENALWQFAKGPTCPNEWKIGTAVHHLGAHAMYISQDQGATATYASINGSAAAWRNFKLSGGQYHIDFDWMARGDELYVCFIMNNSINPTLFGTDNNAIPSGVKSSWKPWLHTGGNNYDTIMSGFAVWRHGSFTITIPPIPGGVNCQLVFFWRNGQNPQPPGGCIDNVQIGQLTGGCSRPSNITFTDITAGTSSGSTGVVTWNGFGNSYDIMYCNTSNGVWHTKTNVTSPDTLTNLSKGMYTIWIRSHCGTDSSTWSVLDNILVFQSLAQCINYIDLHGPNVVAYYGTYPNPYANIGVVDYGSSAKMSRHTVHYGQGEYDPRTGSQLPTVPPGEVASVRLGNWYNQGQAEALLYTFVVDSQATLLLMKYAAVLQHPGHQAADQPRFTMEILDQNNSVIDPTCGKADFIPGTNTSDHTWHSYGSGDELLQWKEWTTIGLNLKPYIGQTLKIRLTTYDCSMVQHYGYAYFTLDCAYATIQGESCGNQRADSIKAPDGFKYEWYNANDSNTVISTSQALTPTENDTNNYFCKVSFAEEASCFFYLNATTKPRYPWPWASFKIHPQNCENRVEFTNESHLYIHGEGIKPDVLLKDIEWDFGNGETSTEQNPVVTFPNAGGTYQVHLRAYMNERACDRDTIITVIVPPIGVHSDTTKKSICQGKTYTWRNKPYTSSIVVSDTLTSSAGCDSIETLDLTVVDRLRSVTQDTICEGISYTWNNNTYTKTTTDSVILNSAAGCDSISVLELVVNPATEATLNTIGTICANDSTFLIQFTNTGTTPATNYRIEFDGAALQEGFTNTTNSLNGSTDVNVTMPQPVTPGYYSGTLVLYDSIYHCPEKRFAFNIAVLIPDTVIIQKFGNVLSLKNKDYNGGFDFTGYQWYRNGQPINGATGAYYYLGEGANFNTSDTYSVMVTLSNGTQIMTCPIKPHAPRPTITAYPTIVARSGNVRLKLPKKGDAKLWTTTGILLKTVKLKAGENDFIVPAREGYYLLDVVTEEGDKATIKILVK